MSLVAGGIGVTLVPAPLRRPPRPGVALRRVQEIDVEVQVFVAVQGGRASRVVGAFLAEVREALGEIPSMPARSAAGV